MAEINIKLMTEEAYRTFQKTMLKSITSNKSSI